MLVRLKEPLRYDNIFLDPQGLHRVYMEDKAGGDSYYLVRCDGPNGEKHKGDHTNTIVWESDEIPWEGTGENRRVLGFINLPAKDFEIAELDNESGHSMLPSMEAFV